MCIYVFVSFCQERIIERLKDQREREDRERLEEVDSYKKENKELKEKVNSLQIELTEKEVGVRSSVRACRGGSTCLSPCFFVEHPALLCVSTVVHLLSVSFSSCLL